QAWSGAWVIAAAGAPGRTPCPGRPRPGRHRQARALGLHLVPGSGDPPVTYRRARAPWDADARRAGRPPGVAGRALAAAGGPRSPDRWPPIGSGSARHAAAVPQRPGTPRPVQAHLLSRSRRRKPYSPAAMSPAAIAVRISSGAQRNSSTGSGGMWLNGDRFVSQSGMSRIIPKYPITPAYATSTHASAVARGSHPPRATAKPAVTHRAGV